MHITAREIGIPDWVINLRHRLAHGPGEQNMTGLHEALKIVLKALIYNEKNYWHDQYILYQEEIEFSNRRKHFTFNALLRCINPYPRFLGPSPSVFSGKKIHNHHW